METALNQPLLFSFISRYYPFDSNPQAFKKGQQFLIDLFNLIINRDQEITDLVPSNMKHLVHLFFSSFSYRFGGIQQCIGAFGNFSMKVNQIKFSDQILQHEQISEILDPFKSELTKISAFLKLQGKIPEIDHQMMIRKKTQFLKWILQLQESKKVQKKKRRMKKKISQKMNLSALISSNYIQKSHYSIQQERRTEVDEVEFTKKAIIQTFKTKNSIGTLASNKNLSIFFENQNQVNEDSQNQFKSNSVNQVHKHLPQLQLQNQSKVKHCCGHEQEDLVLRFDDYFTCKKKFKKMKSKVMKI